MSDSQGLTPPTNNSRSSSPAGNGNGADAKPRIVSGSLRDRIARFENPAAAPLLPTHPFGTAGPAHPSTSARGGLVGNRIPSFDPKNAGAGMLGGNRKVSENKGLIGNRIPSGVSNVQKTASSGRSASPAGSVDSSTASGAASGSPITSRSSSPPTSPGMGLPPSLLAATLPGGPSRSGAMTPSSTRADAGDESSVLSAPSTPVQAPSVPTGGHYDLNPPNLKLVEGQTPNAAQIALTRGLSTQSNAGSTTGSIAAPSLGSSRLSQYDPSEGSENNKDKMDGVSGISTPTSTPKAERAMQLEGSTRGSVAGDGSENGQADMGDLDQRLDGLGLEGIDRDPTPAPPSPSAQPGEADFVKATETDGIVNIEDAPKEVHAAASEETPSDAQSESADNDVPDNATHPNDLPDPSKPTKDEAPENVPIDRGMDIDEIAGPELDEDPNKAADLDDLKAGKLSHDHGPPGVHTLDQNPINTIAETGIAQGLDESVVPESELKEQGGVAGQRMEDIEQPTSVEPPKEQEEDNASDDGDVEVRTATEQSKTQSGNTDSTQQALAKDQMPDIIQGTQAAGVRLDDAMGAGSGPLTSGETDQLKEMLVEERKQHAEREGIQSDPSEGLQTEEDRDEGKSRRTQLISALDQNKDTQHNLQEEVDEESRAKAREVTEKMTKDIRVDETDDKTEQEAELEADEAKGGQGIEGTSQEPYGSGEEGYGTITKSLSAAADGKNEDAAGERSSREEGQGEASGEDVPTTKPVQVQIEPAPIAQPAEDMAASGELSPPASEINGQAQASSPPAVEDKDASAPSTPPTFPTPPNEDPDVVDPVPAHTEQSPTSTPIDPSFLKSFPDVPDEEKPRVQVHVSHSPAASPAKKLHASAAPETPLAEIPGKSKSLPPFENEQRDAEQGGSGPASGRSSVEVDATPEGGARLAKRGSTRRSPKSPLLDDEDPGDFEPGEGWAVVTKERERK